MVGGRWPGQSALTVGGPRSHFPHRTRPMARSAPSAPVARSARSARSAPLTGRSENACMPASQCREQGKNRPVHPNFPGVTDVFHKEPSLPPEHVLNGE